VHNIDDDSNASSGYAAQLETLRSAAKWLLAAAAAVGALLVAGLQLTGIGRLPLTSWRLYVALAAAVLTLSAIGYIVKAASNVLTQEWLTLADFTDHATGLPGPWGEGRGAPAYLRPIEDHLTGSRHELFGYAAPTLPELHNKLHESHMTMWRADLDVATRQQAAETSSELRKATRDVVQAANYYHVLRLFKALRIRMVWAAVTGVVGITVFAYVVNPPQDPAPVEVRIVLAP
jgi:hypothetical protein